MTKLIRHAALVQRLDHSHMCYATDRHWPGLRVTLLWQRMARITPAGTRDRRRGARLQGGHFDQSPDGVDDWLRLAHAVSENAYLHARIRRLTAMKMTLEVKDRKEADAIRTGMEDPSVKAFVMVMGALASLPSDRMRARVLTFVSDTLDEQNGQAAFKLETPT
jgi:hypothetical protein